MARAHVRLAPDVDIQLTYNILFERSEFLIATCKKNKTDSLCVWMFG